MAGFASVLALGKMLALSVGMLVGTAIAVVMPEGVELLPEDPNTVKWKVAFLFVLGFPVLLGFMLMYIVDHYQTIRNHFYPAAGPAAKETYLASILSTPITISLILHSCVDGFALGLSSLEDGLSMHYILYLMIILHKLPTAFSLSVVLLEQEMAHHLIYAHTLAFSLATSLASILVYPSAKLLLSYSTHLALLLLFSAGTFLYIVIHLLLHEHAPGDYDSIPSQNNRDDFVRIVLTVAGTLVPLVLSIAGVD
ncbi:hypothetical protein METBISCDRAFT_25180 [Metschnikowia bicuspidata]|uniref:Zinc/iron permease n=1 Tax=Metschnikowia bicuspidata TaxID=27322 RepID=A0A4P9ZIG5_9ASCO|nr:hypothetical protein METBISCDRAFT_25180 [Metschnikowia bicuspidata]